MDSEFSTVKEVCYFWIRTQARNPHSSGRGMRSLFRFKQKKSKDQSARQDDQRDKGLGTVHKHERQRL